jgi:hypothetical protein
VNLQYIPLSGLVESVFGAFSARALSHNGSSRSSLHCYRNAVHFTFATPLNACPGDTGFPPALRRLRLRLRRRRRRRRRHHPCSAAKPTPAPQRLSTFFHLASHKDITFGTTACPSAIRNLISAFTPTPPPTLPFSAATAPPLIKWPRSPP